MATNRQHTKPAVSKDAKDAEKVTQTLYMALTQEGAPRATPTGYIMAACTLLKMLVDQAEQQGADKEALKQYAFEVVNRI